MIQKLALTLLTLTLLLQIVHAQTPSQKLESIFSDYELVQLDPEAINRQVRDFGEPLELQFDGTTFVFDLDPRDLRSPRYRAEATGADGLRRHVQPSPVHTFRGRVVGQEHIQGRFTITEALVHESELARNEPGSQVHHLPRAYDDGLPSSAIRLRM